MTADRGRDGAPEALYPEGPDVDGRRPAAGAGVGVDLQRAAPRRIPAERWRCFEGYVAEIFEALGMDLGTPGTARTPARFLRALLEATDGYEGDPGLVTAFPTECRGGPDCRISQVVEGPIPYQALCEHHGLPFFGRAWVGYIAHERILGISKLTRLVRLFARRFTIQERLGHQIVEALDDVLEPHGAAVCLDGVHLCVRIRGVRETESRTRVTFWRGAYERDPALRAEFLDLCRR
ncbi:MAG TPA: GTP cyclohydrolase I [Acidimicrobiales bacterium]|nr:GTP cyclohydrolase I [Acidimicrobiales bacterium]